MELVVADPRLTPDAGKAGPFRCMDPPGTPDYKFTWVPEPALGRPERLCFVPGANAAPDEPIGLEGVRDEGQESSVFLRQNVALQM